MIPNFPLYSQSTTGYLSTFYRKEKLATIVGTELVTPTDYFMNVKWWGEQNLAFKINGLIIAARVNTDKFNSEQNVKLG